MTATDASSYRDSPLVPTGVVPTHAPLDVVDYDRPHDAPSRPPTRRLVLPALRQSRADRVVWPVVAVVIAGLYLYALLGFWAPAHPGTDQNGYFAGGRQFAATLSTGLAPESDFNFVGRMWVTAPSGVNYPKYPLGLPILFAACLWIFGERGLELAHLVSPIAAALATLGVFAIARRLAGGFIGAMAMLLLACGQTMLTLAVNPNSHAAGTCTVVWGIFFLIRWLETGAVWRGVACGALLGFAYLIRYTDGLLALPLGVAMLYAARWALPSARRAGFTLGGAALLAALALIVARFSGAALVARFGWPEPFAADGGRPFVALVACLALAAVASAFVEWRSLWRLLAVGGAWLVPVVYLTAFNMVAMRSFTSYAGTNESTGFGVGYFVANWEKMIRVVHDQGLFFMAPIGVLGLICMYRRLPLVATILTLWLVPSVLLYTAYYWAPDMMGVSYSRFVLTQLPALMIAAAWLLGQVIRRPLDGWLGRVGVGAIVFVSCSLGIYRTVLGTDGGQRVNTRANLELQARHNRNLHGLGVEVRRAIGGPANRAATRPATDDAVDAADGTDVLLFADGERLNHFQWIGGWQLFGVESFNVERAARQVARQIDATEPDPIDPSRVKFLAALYKDKDQRALQAEQNALIASSLARGRRVYYALPDAASKTFARQLDRRQFDVVPVGHYADVPAPRTAADLLAPGERPKQPVDRFGRGRGWGGAPAIEKQTYHIGQVVPKQTTTAPTTVPATKPN